MKFHVLRNDGTADSNAKSLGDALVEAVEHVATWGEDRTVATVGGGVGGYNDKAKYELTGVGPGIDGKFAVTVIVRPL